MMICEHLWVFFGIFSCNLWGFHIVLWSCNIEFEMCEMNSVGFWDIDGGNFWSCTDACIPMIARSTLCYLVLQVLLSQAATPDKFSIQWNIVNQKENAKVAQEFLYVRLCWMIMVLWFCFFLSSWFDLGVKHGKIKQRISEIFSYQCQGHALVSVKAIGFPVFLKENISQIQLVIAQGKHTNIDPEKLVL